LVEAHPRLAAQCRQNRPGSVVVHSALAEIASGDVEFNCVDGAAGPGLLSFCKADQDHIQRCASEGYKITPVRVPKTTLNVLCADLAEPIDMVSLDLEGFELNALKGFDLQRFRPRLLVIEVKSGEQAGNLDQYLKTHGYHLGRRVGENNFYVRQEDLNRLMQL
jgi:FkbM family methyltransferase